MKKGVNNSMKHYLIQNLSILLLLFHLTSCKEASHHTTTADNQAPVQLKYTGLTFNPVDSIENGLGFTINSIDTITNKNSKVIEVDFNVHSTGQFWKDLKQQGIQAVYVSLSCSGRKPFKSAVNYYSDRFLSLHDEFLLIKEGNRILQYSIPLRSLELDKGVHEVQLTIEAIPVRFKQDSLKSDLKEIYNFSHKPIALKKVTFQINAPELITTSIEVLKFRLNTKVCDPSKFDYAFGGTGYPDLFWDVLCGDDYIYHSPEIKNAVQYHKVYQSTAFKCTADDQITIRVVDFDQGPFNRQHDIIETWTGKINDISIDQPDTLIFGNLEYLILRRTNPKKSLEKTSPKTKKRK
jgi:hypothetical protein